MHTILKEPLLHFLILAAGLFVLNGALSGGTADASTSTIVVDRAALLEFIQFRKRLFDPTIAEQTLAELGPDERDRLIREFVREEALSRQAKELGLDQYDYVIKRRLVQNMEYIARGFSERLETVTEQEARTYYEENTADFTTQPTITFTHIFFRSEGRGETEATRLAQRAKETLDAALASGLETAEFGDRFLFGRTFSNRARPAIEGQFGVEMTAELFNLSPTGKWAGPLTSEYGAHLVLVKAVDRGRQLSFDEARGQATRLAQDALVEARMYEVTDQIVQEFDVRIEDMMSKE